MQVYLHDTCKKEVVDICIGANIITDYHFDLMQKFLFFISYDVTYIM